MTRDRLCGLRRAFACRGRLHGVPSSGEVASGRGVPHRGAAGTGPSLPPWTAGLGAARPIPGAATSGAGAGRGRATNRPELSRRGTFRGIEALVSLLCSIIYSMGLFMGLVYLPGGGLIGRGLFEVLLMEGGGGEQIIDAAAAQNTMRAVTVAVAVVWGASAVAVTGTAVVVTGGR